MKNVYSSFLVIFSRFIKMGADKQIGKFNRYIANGNYDEECQSGN